MIIGLGLRTYLYLISRRSRTRRIPEGPSIQIERASESVCPMTRRSVGAPERSRGCARARSTIHSLPARLLPHPRPLNTRCTSQSPGGGICSGRLSHHHSPRTISSRISFDCRSSQRRRCSGGSPATRSARLCDIRSWYVQLHPNVGQGGGGVESAADKPTHVPPYRPTGQAGPGRPKPFLPTPYTRNPAPSPTCCA